MYAGNVNTQVLSVYNYDRNTEAFSYARKNGRKRIKAYTVHFHLKVVLLNYVHSDVFLLIGMKNWMIAIIVRK